MLNNIISNLHGSKYLGKFFHTVNYCLQKELIDCEKVLDIGCGPDSPLQYCKNVKYSVGVEVYKPYLQQSKKKKIHNEYFNEKIENLKFKENEFDAVIMIEVFEHLDKRSALKILKKVEKWASKKVIVTTPNGYIEQGNLDKNPYQKHLSGWTVDEMEKLGFECKGLAGLKMLRKPTEEETMGDDLTVSIKYEPKLFWFGVATLSQLLVFFMPKIAFELFCVKNLQ